MAAHCAVVEELFGYGVELRFVDGVRLLLMLECLMLALLLCCFGSGVVEGGLLKLNNTRTVLSRHIRIHQGNSHT
jgi:hypothetical protein